VTIPSGATSTVNYPQVTVSDGAWISTITQAPLTLTEWVFDVVTLTQGSSNKKNKRTAPVFLPTPATTPFWPALVYTGGIDGLPTTTSATVPFPKPPQSIGPNAPPTPSGSWPNRLIQPVYGSPESPLVDECSFFDPSCISQPWFWNNITRIFGGGDEENYWDLPTKCPPVISSSSSSSKTTSATKTTPTRPAPSPLEQGDARTNSVACFNSGENTENVRMVNSASSFCSDIQNDSLGPGYFHSMDFLFDYNGGIGSVTITISLQIKPRCSFMFDETLCNSIPICALRQLQL
jgi:hypothetical protein